MDTALREEVRRLKASYAKHGQHTGTKYALAAARRMLKSPPIKVEWDPYGVGRTLASGTAKHEGFDILVEVKYEECPDYSHIGKFSQHWAEGAIEMEKDEEYTPPRHSFTYFIPANPEYRNLDWREMKNILREDMIPAWVSVTASLDGMELADANIGGCYYEPDNEDAIAYDYIDDLIHEAVEEAKERVENKCPTCGRL